MTLMSISMPFRAKHADTPCGPLATTARHRMVYERGFTLVEMVIVIVLTGIVFAIGGALLSQVFNSYFAATNISEADWQGKVAFERMTREIRLVRSNTTTDLDFASGAQIRFTDMYGNNVCFYRDAANSRLMRSADGPTTNCGATNPQVLADNVSSLSFTYWDKSAVTAVAVTGVYYIAVAVTVSRGDYSGSFRTNIRPRNFF